MVSFFASNWRSWSNCEKLAKCAVERQVHIFKLWILWEIRQDAACAEGDALGKPQTLALKIACETLCISKCTRAAVRSKNTLVQFAHMIYVRFSVMRISISLKKWSTCDAAHFRQDRLRCLSRKLQNHDNSKICKNAKETKSVTTMDGTWLEAKMVMTWQPQQETNVAGISLSKSDNDVIVKLY